MVAMVTVPDLLVKLIFVTNILVNISSNQKLLPDQTVLSATQENISLTPTPTGPLPTQTKTPTPTPTQIPPQSQTGTSSDLYIMGKINSHRLANGLSPFETHPLVCEFAGIRSKELQSDFSHVKFDMRIQKNTLPYPGYTKIAENIASTNYYKEVFSLWKNSPGHNKLLLENAKYACVAGSGRYWAFESWTP